MKILTIISLTLFTAITLQAQELKQWRVETGPSTSSVKKETAKTETKPARTVVRNFSEGLAAINPGNGKWGFINEMDEIEIEPVYAAVQDFSEGLAAVTTDDKKRGYINVWGDTVIKFQKYNILGDFNEGIALVRGWYGKFGYINTVGDTIIDFKYTSAKNFSEGLASVTIAGEWKNGFLTGAKWGVIDKSDNMVISAKPYTIYEFHQGKAIIRSKDKCGVIDKSGRQIIPLKYNSIDQRKDGTYKMGIKTQKQSLFGIFSADGKEILPAKYAGVGEFHDGIAAFKSSGKDGRWGFVSIEGKIIVPPTYKEVSDFSEGIAAVLVAGSNKWGYINKEGKFVIQPQFHRASAFADGIAPVRKDFGQKWQMIDKNQNVIWEISGYTNIETFKNGYARVTRGTLDGYIDKNGKELIEPIHRYVSDVKDDGTVTVSNVGSQGFRQVVLIENPNRDKAVAINEKTLRENPSKDKGETEFALGATAFDKGIFAEAHKQWRIAALHHHPEAAYGLALLYYSGKGTSKNQVEYFYWLRQAANRQHPKAMEHLGSNYVSGLSITKDVDEGIKWLVKAGEEGLLDAYSTIGSAFLTRTDGKKDASKAIYYLEKANNSLGYYQLGEMYLKGISVKKDETQAIKYFTKANSSQGYYQLGKMYVNKKDVAQATKYFTNANTAEAYYELSRLGTANYIQHLATAAQKGHPISAYKLGEIYYNRKSYSEAYRYINMVVNLKYGGSFDAEKWTNTVIRENYARALYLMGLMYENGFHVSKSKTEADKYFGMAADNGNQQALAKLPKKPVSISASPQPGVWGSSSTTGNSSDRNHQAVMQQHQRTMDRMNAEIKQMRSDLKNRRY